MAMMVVDHESDYWPHILFNGYKQNRSVKLTMDIQWSINTYQDSFGGF